MSDTVAVFMARKAAALDVEENLNTKVKNSVLLGASAMFKTIAAFGTTIILTSFVSTAQAQSPSRSEPMGSAASLEGLKERSVSRPTPNAPVLSPQSSTDVPGGSERGWQLNNKVQLLISPERGTSQVGVYPADDPSSGNKVQVLYQLNQQ